MLFNLFSDWVCKCPWKEMCFFLRHFVFWLITNCVRWRGGWLLPSPSQKAQVSPIQGCSQLEGRSWNVRTQSKYCLLKFKMSHIKAYWKSKLLSIPAPLGKSMGVHPVVQEYMNQMIRFALTFNKMINCHRCKKSSG